MMDIFSFIRPEGRDGIEPSGSDLVARWNHFESLKILMPVQQGFRIQKPIVFLCTSKVI